MFTDIFYGSVVKVLKTRVSRSFQNFDWRGIPHVPSKRWFFLKTEMKIGTHDGGFHCDEVLACVLLKSLPEYKNAEIIRTRNGVILEECDVVVDVGGIYDPKCHRYDHHQRSFNESMSSVILGKPWFTKLSSAGLIYAHFGRRVISEITQLHRDDSKIEPLFDKMYQNFVEEIDGIDNGISQYDGEPRYLMTSNISSRIGRLNPAWNDANQDEWEQFLKAMEFVKVEFEGHLRYYLSSWLPAREYVEKAIETRFEVHNSGEIMEMPLGGLPWQDHYFILEEELALDPKVQFIIFMDQSSVWRVKSIPVRQDSFESRCTLVDSWKGLRDTALSDIAGISDCIFAHASGFIGGNKTRQGAITMAEKSLAAKTTG